MGRSLRRSWQVGSEGSVVAESRHRIGSHAADLPEDLAGDVELMASELLSNAVVHGEGPVTVGLERSEHRVRVEVTDASERLPTLQGPDDLLAEGRRGFMLVDRLATRWGFERHRDHSKTVWFEVEG